MKKKKSFWALEALTLTMWYYVTDESYELNIKQD